MKKLLMVAIAFSACRELRKPDVERARDNFEMRADVQRMCCAWTHRGDLLCSGMLAPDKPAPVPVKYSCNAEACMWVSQ